jgi:hypothetical protein
MARWAGWGAGPSGAGASGGPGRIFLGAALAGCVAVAAILANDSRWAAALVTALGAAYFALRLFAGLGRRAG